VLEDPTPCAHGGERSSKATVVGAHGMPVPSLIDRRELAPRRARWVRYHRMRPLVLPRVSSDVPRIDAWQSKVRPVLFDKQRRDRNKLAHIISAVSCILWLCIQVPSEILFDNVRKVQVVGPVVASKTLAQLPQLVLYSGLFVDKVRKLDQRIFACEHPEVSCAF
jgi:hypothetical protein